MSVQSRVRGARFDCPLLFNRASSQQIEKELLRFLCSAGLVVGALDRHQLPSCTLEGLTPVDALRCKRVARDRCTEQGVFEAAGIGAEVPAMARALSQSRSSPCRGRAAEGLLEGARERRFGVVAYELGNLRQRGVAAAQF